MNELLILSKIDDIVRNQIKCNSYNFRYKIKTVSSDNEKIELENSEFVFIINETIDIPITAQIVFESADNYIITSKSEFESDKLLELETFSNYLKIRTSNYGTSFVPFKLKLLVITPYN